MESIINNHKNKEIIKLSFFSLFKLKAEHFKLKKKHNRKRKKY